MAGKGELPPPAPAAPAIALAAAARGAAVEAAPFFATARTGPAAAAVLPVIALAIVPAHRPPGAIVDVIAAAGLIIAAVPAVIGRPVRAVVEIAVIARHAVAISEAAAIAIVDASGQRDQRRGAERDHAKIHRPTPTGTAAERAATETKRARVAGVPRAGSTFDDPGAAGRPLPDQ